MFVGIECRRLFKKVTGETISPASSPTVWPRASIFCGTSYFIEVFKAKFGVTPHRFRKEAR